MSSFNLYWTTLIFGMRMHTLLVQHKTKREIWTNYSALFENASMFAMATLLEFVSWNHVLVFIMNIRNFSMKDLFITDVVNIVIWNADRSIILNFTHFVSIIIDISYVLNRTGLFSSQKYTLYIRVVRFSSGQCKTKQKSVGMFFNISSWEKKLFYECFQKICPKFQRSKLQRSRSIKSIISLARLI